MKRNFRYLQSLVLSLLLLGFSTVLYAKNDGITVYGTCKIKKGVEGGMQIRLLRNGINEQNTLSENGKFEYALQFNNQYELQFSKSGYITKKIVISTDVPERVLKANNDFPPFKIEIELFPEVEGGNYAIFDEPVAMVIYDKELDDFDFDRAYNAEIEEEIKKIETKIINTPLVPKEDNDSLLYSQLIKKADSEFEGKSYVNARKNYEKAQKVKPSEKYPQIRINLIDKILADLKKREEQKSKNDSYYTLIDKADILLEDKKYQSARSYYVEASKIKADQQYPKDKIKLIDQILGNKKAEERKYKNLVALADRYFGEQEYKLAQKEYENALKMRKDEVYPKEQIKRIERLLTDLKSKKEREDNYQQIIKQADNLFGKENWADAQNLYEKASDIFPKKKYPKEKIAEIQKLLKVEKKTLGKYTVAITKADAYFKKEDWKKAQGYYEKALNIKANEVYPQEQIKKITQNLGDIARADNTQKEYEKAIQKADRAFREKNWNKAKEHYFSALKIKENEDYPQKQISIVEEKLAELAVKKAEKDHYNQKLKEADTSYDQKNWNDAMVQYKVALEIKPSEKYPKQQLKKIERFLQEELKRKSAQEKEDSYTNFIAQGDKNYEEKNWDKALANYEGALQIKPKEKYPQNRIDAINKALKDAKNAEDLQKRYDALLQKASDLLQKAEFSSAIMQYEKAQNLKPEETYPQTQITKIKAQISAKELAEVEAKKKAKQANLRNAYDIEIANADKNLQNKRYAFARAAYRKALSVIPDEEYPKKKLQEIEQLLAQKSEKDNLYYKKIIMSAQDSVRHYQRILPKETDKKRYVKIIKATDANEDRYEMLMKKAQEAESKGNYPFAKAYYRQAFLEKQTLVVFNKLKELDSRTQLKPTE